MTTAATIGKWPQLVSVTTAQCDITFDQPERLYTVHHLGLSSTGGDVTTPVFCLLNNTTGGVEATYSTTGTVDGKAILNPDVSFPIPVGTKAQFIVTTGTVLIQFVSTPRGNWYPDST